MPQAAVVDLLQRGLASLSPPTALPRELAASLAVFAELLFRWSGRVNLTAHRSAAEIAERLILDAVALDTALPAVESVADIGSGAGLPGIPLALLHPEASVTLLEARERRHHFQSHVVRTLGLRNLELKLGRAEALPPLEHDLVVAQALAPAERALSWMLPWSRPQGFLALPRALPLRPFRLPPGVECLEVRTYRVPLSGRERALWLGRRKCRAL